MKSRQEDNAGLRYRIIETACELFQSKGFDNTTVTDLLEVLQIEEQIFYSYFRSKDQLLEVVWSES